MKKCGDIGLRGWIAPWLLHSHGMEPNFVQRVHCTFLWITLSISLYKYDHIHPQILPTSRT